jgi:predicted PurR-regulated permease PerM
MIVRRAPAVVVTPPAAIHVADPAPGALEASRAEWRRLGRRIAAQSPAAVGRALLAVVTAGLVVWVAAATWPALMPFLVGGVIAYGLLPAVDVLGRFMPRLLASAMCVLAVLAVIVGVAVLLVPPLAIGTVQLAAGLPTRAEVDQFVVDLSSQLGATKEGQAVLVPLLEEAVTAVRDNLQSAGGAGGAGLTSAVVHTAIGVVGTAITGVLALIVLPTWILAVTSRGPKERQALQTRITSSIRPDALAIIRIVDRIASAYLRGFVATAFVVSVLTYLGIRSAEAAGVSSFAQALPVSVFAGLTQLVPDIGPLFGFAPALIVIFIAPDRAIAYVGIYIGARFVAGRMIGDRVMAPAQNVHPAILVPAIVALSNLGVVWLFAAGPMIAIAADVIRYTHGRLSDPPAPAGVLPHEHTRPGRPILAGGLIRVPAPYRALTSR